EMVMVRRKMNTMNSVIQALKNSHASDSGASELWSLKYAKAEKDRDETMRRNAALSGQLTLTKAEEVECLSALEAIGRLSAGSVPRSEYLQVIKVKDEEFVSQLRPHLKKGTYGCPQS
ncbi:MAG: hypothetical protein ACKPKO_12240, partial [Candidatus Fonsibacter sp.]